MQSIFWDRYLFRIASLRSFLSREIRGEGGSEARGTKNSRGEIFFLFSKIERTTSFGRRNRKEGRRGKKLPAINEVYVSTYVAPSFDPAAGPSPIPWTTQAGTDATHLRRVLRNLCGRLAVGQHSQRIKIPCRTCGLSLNCPAFPSPTIAANRTDEIRLSLIREKPFFLPLSLSPSTKKKKKRTSRSKPTSRNIREMDQIA